MYVDDRSASGLDDVAPGFVPPAHALAENTDPMRLLACLIAALVYIWQEQRDYLFPPIHFAVVVLGVGVLSFELYLFLRGPSRIQPPAPSPRSCALLAGTPWRYTPSSLPGSELITKLVPNLAP